MGAQRRWLILWVVVALSWSLGLSGPRPSLAQPGYEESPMTATLEAVSGVVAYQSVDTGAWQTVERRAALVEGDMVRTEADSSAVVIWLDDGTLTELGPSTTLVINELSTPDAPAISIRLIAGRIFNAITTFDHEGSHFEVTTPTLNAAVRGTVFAVEVQADAANGHSTLVVQEGAVAVTAVANPNGPVTVQADQFVQSTLTEFTAPLAINQASDPGLQALIQQGHAFEQEQRPMPPTNSVVEPENLAPEEVTTAADNPSEHGNDEHNGDHHNGNNGNHGNGNNDHHGNGHDGDGGRGHEGNGHHGNGHDGDGGQGHEGNGHHGNGH